MSKFVLNCALAQAKKNIQEQDAMRLNARDSQAFFDTLASPVKFNNKLIAALQEHEENVTVK